MRMTLIYDWRACDHVRRSMIPAARRVEHVVRYVRAKENPQTIREFHTQNEVLQNDDKHFSKTALTPKTNILQTNKLLHDESKA